MRRTCCVLAALAALLGGMLVSAPNASAYTREWLSVTSDGWVNGKAWCIWRVPETPAVGCWYPTGDDLQIADTEADGKRVGLDWKTDYGRFGICVDAKGADHPVGDSGLQGGSYSCNTINIAEGHTIRFRVGTCDASKVDCGVLANWGEWSQWSEAKPT